MPYAQDRMIEQCLSHSDGKRTEQVCNRGQYVHEGASRCRNDAIFSIYWHLWLFMFKLVRIYYFVIAQFYKGTLHKKP